MKKEKTYFEEYYTTYIKEHHPDLIIKLGAEAEKHVEHKCRIAQKMFEDYREEGHDMFFSLEVAKEYLKEGLKFSKYDNVLSVLKSRFIKSYRHYEQNNGLKTLIITLVNKCEDIFIKYIKNDDYVYNDEMETEIEARIKQFLNERNLNGALINSSNLKN
jgi:hypothetical protein